MAMRRLVIFLTVMLAGFGTAAAQPHGGGARNGGDGQRIARTIETEDPVLLAEEQTGRLDRLVGLSPSQYNKVYRFHLRQVKKLRNRRQGTPEEMRADMMRIQEKTARKYRRVLTTPQYERWASFEAERSFRRIYDQPFY